MCIFFLKFFSLLVFKNTDKNFTNIIPVIEVKFHE